VAGAGPDEDAIRAAAEPLGDRVSLVGRVDAQAVRELMGRARAVVAPAIPRLQPEGAGLTVIEAAMLGRPVVVSDDLALREFVDATGCGIVVPPESPDALAQALDRLLSDHDLAAKLGRAGSERAARRHSTEAVADAVRGVYRRAVARASGPEAAPPEPAADAGGPGRSPP
jgi:glycosyltransferase involved in cell wall biosynthesis